MGQEKPAAQDAPLSCESLAELFPHLGYTVLQDVVEQCDNDHAAALERLLAMSTEASEGGRPSPADRVPRAQQVLMARRVLRSAPAPTLPTTHTVSLLLPDYPGAPAAAKEPHLVPDPNSWSSEPDPWPGDAPGAGQRRAARPPASAAPRATRRRQRGVAGCSRGWWPPWPHDPGEARASGPSSAPCRSEPAPAARAQRRQPARGRGSRLDWQQPPPPPAPPQPPDPRPAAPPALRPAGAHAPAAAILEAKAAEPSLMSMLPHLARLLINPWGFSEHADGAAPDSLVSSPQLDASHHGAGEPDAAQPDAADHAAQRQADASQPNAGQPNAAQPDAGQPDAAQQGYAPEELLLAVDFHADMFPDLRREVVADVLQRHSEAPQVALDQLMMLSAAVAEAAAGPSYGGSPTASAGHLEGSDVPNAAAVPDARSWGDDDADLLGEEGGGGGRRSPSWEESGGPHVVDRHIAEAGMGTEEKLRLLSAEFGSLPAGDVSAALAACDGSLMAAAQLLRAMTAEEGEGAKGSAAPCGTATADTAAVAEGVQAGPAGAAPAGLEELARSFPTASREASEVALIGCGGDLSAARRTLREAGYAELAQQDGLPSAGGLPEAVEPPPPAAVPPGPPPTLPLPLGEATHRRNQAIFQEERAAQQRLQQCYRRCFQAATAAYKRGDRATADEQRAQGQEYRRQYEEERRRASRRIGKRVNAGALPLITVDLHGKYVDEALELVEAGIRSLPESIPGGVVVRYITGKGLHSAGGAPRIKPQVLRLLAERGLPHEDRGGFVEVTLAPAT